MFRMSDDIYDVLKYIAQIALPAIATAYFGLSKLWGWPYGEEIVGTISIVDALLGGLLKLSTDQYINNQTKQLDKKE